MKKINTYRGYSVWLYFILLSSVSCLVFLGCAESNLLVAQNLEKTDYVVGPEDILRVEVWKEPDLTRDVAVNPDGNIALPLINQIKVSGLTVPEIKKLLEEKFSKFIEVPSVNVSVIDPKGYKIYVMGNVKTPGVLQPKSEITFLQAISMAGGFSEWANQTGILIKRREHNAEKTIKINYNKIISGEQPELNIIMKSGDTLIVP